MALAAVSCTASSTTDPNYKFREGDETNYRFETNQKGSVTLDGETAEFSLNMVNNISQKIMSVDEKGVATIDAYYQDTNLTVDGEELLLPEFANTLLTYKMNGDGSIDNVRGTHGLAGPLGERQFDAGQIFQFQGPAFREGNLQKGDTWQQVIEIPMPDIEPLQATIDYTYEGMGRIKGKEAAKVSFVFDPPGSIVLNDLEGPVKVTGHEEISGTAFFSVQDGKTLTAGGKGPLKLTMSMPSEGGGEDIERLVVDIKVDFTYEIQ